LLAIRSGIKDAKSGTRPYFWSLLSTPDRRHRLEMIKDGWKSVGRLFFLAVGLDLIYQIIVQPSIRLRAAIFVAIVLAIVPYTLLRGIATRIARRVMHLPPAAADGASHETTPRSPGPDVGRP